MDCIEFIIYLPSGVLTMCQLMVPCLCSDKEAIVVVSLPEVVEVSPPSPEVVEMPLPPP